MPAGVVGIGGGKKNTTHFQTVFFSDEGPESGSTMVHKDSGLISKLGGLLPRASLAWPRAK
jgi:hypothetical protein